MAIHLTAYREKGLFSIKKRGMQTMNFDKQAFVDVDLNWRLQKILITANTGTIGSKELVRQLSEKDNNFLKSGAFSKVTLTLEETKGRKPMALRKFAEGYADKEFR